MNEVDIDYTDVILVSGETKKSPNAGKIKYYPRFYASLTKPYGLLDRDVPCQALWHYYVTMLMSRGELQKSSLVDRDGDPIELPNKDFSENNLRQLFKSIAEIYSVEPHSMANAWPVVNEQAAAMGLPRIPAGDKRRGVS